MGRMAHEQNQNHILSIADNSQIKL